ncbi:MAG TPA: asparagine synthase (glutamine-hydrolyzing) [Chitinophagaceae bacterium]|nr:asparagine synthase (glutamine-hydrolyzing) [Chitinophagaceae bacterium]
MCGIAGIISANQGLVTNDRLTKMTDALRHRGPDGEQHWINGIACTGFGHRRLSVIDLSAAAAQPMHYLQRYTLVHNGEIYNYVELRNTLQQKGYHFTTASDTEVILAAYDCWKEACLAQLDGMFAFAIWDETTQTLFAARDRMGEKPFYYYYDQQQFVFASEIKALWAAGIPREVNKVLLYNFLTLGYTQHPQAPEETAYNAIQKLPAAAYLTVSPATTRSPGIKSYWRPSITSINQRITATDAVESFAELFRASVQKRLRTDVPLGTSLSGGLDSAAIAVTIQQLQAAGASLQTFSAVFPGFAGDEARYSKLLAAEKGLRNDTTTPTAESFAQDFQQLCFHQEGYMASASVYAQYKVFELAKANNVTVLLDGQGADELMAGYHKYYHWYWQQLYKYDRPLLKKEINAARSLGVEAPWGWQNKLAALFPTLAGSYLTSRRKREQRRHAALSNGFVEAFGTSYYQLPRQDSLQEVLAYNTFNNGLEELLQYADKNSMAHGREVRLPFLQQQLVEFFFSLPAHLKIKDGYTKWLLRAAMDKQLPPQIAWRKDKIGFEPPQKQWMQHAAVQENIQLARQKMMQAGVLHTSILKQPVQASDAHAAENLDWRILVSAQLL